MRIDILTLFPEMFEALNHSILKRAQDNNLIKINVVNIRDFSKDIHKKCDDYPYGGGAGMVMMPQPILDAYNSIKSKDNKVIFTSPKGKVFNQNMAKDLSKYKHLVILCGHYEGVDQRVLDLIDAEEVSIGDYVLTGGELPCMVMIDSISRNISGVINEESLTEESFQSSLLEYPQYTRPEIFEGKKVPSVLLSGNHKEIENWRKEQSYITTKKIRPDLLKDIKVELLSCEYKEFRNNVKKLHFSNLSKERISNNLKIQDVNYLYFIQDLIKNKKNKIYKKGKNYYCSDGKIIVTINKNTNTIITANYIK